MAPSSAQRFHQHKDIPGFYLQPDIPEPLSFRITHWEDLDIGKNDDEHEASVKITAGDAIFNSVREEAVVSLHQKSGFSPVPGVFFCPGEVQGVICFRGFVAGGGRIVLRIYQGDEDDNEESEDKVPEAKEGVSTSRIPEDHISVQAKRNTKPCYISVSESNNDLIYIPKQQNEKIQEIELRNDSEIMKYPFPEGGHIGQVFRFVNCGILSFPKSTASDSPSKKKRKTTEKNSEDSKKKKTKPPYKQIEDVEFRVSSSESELENFRKRLRKVARKHYVEIAAKRDPKTAPKDHGDRK